MARVYNPDNRKRGHAGRFGTDTFALPHKLTDWTANDTANEGLATPFHPVPGTPDYIEGISYGADAAALDSDGNVTIKIQKVRAGVAVDLTETVSVEASIINDPPQTVELPLLTTLTPAQLTVLRGDRLRAVKVNSSAAIDTQPLNPTVVVEYAAGG
jgi:hypothetical protein